MPEVISTVTTQRKRQASKNFNNRDYLQRLEMLSEDLKSYNNQYSDSNLLSDTIENQPLNFKEQQASVEQILESQEDEELLDYI